MAALLAVGLGAGIAALVAAWRTEHAYPHYLRDAEVADVVVNPSLRTDQARAIIESTPGIEEIRSDVLLVATIDDGSPRSVAEIDSGLQLQIRVSDDGRYLDQDRPVVYQGRMVAGGNDVFLDVKAADDLGVEVGDSIPLAFWDARDAAVASIAASHARVEPTGSEIAEVVGIGVFADGVLTDELYPRRTAVVSHDLAAPYLCPAPLLPAAAVTVEQAVSVLYPDGCAVTYAYFSLQVDGDDDGVPAVLASIAERLEEESARLPDVMAEHDASYYMVPTVTADERERIARSLDPSVTALRLFGVAAMGASLGLAVLAFVRLARPARPQAAVWWQLGATRRQRAAAIGVPIAGGAVIGVAGAVVVAWLTSGLGPVASARVLDPDAALILPAPVVLPAAVAAMLVLLAGVGVAAAGASGVAERVGPDRPSSLAKAAARTGNVPLTQGVRAAVRGVAAITVTGAITTAVISVLGSVVFSTNLAGVVDTPERYGWAYDAAAITGGGYGAAAVASIAASLDRPDVDHWGIAALGVATIEGAAVPFVAHRTGFDDLPLQVVEGALPAGDEQIALGALTAERLGLAVGDTVTVATNYGRHSGVISGLVVPPPVGPILTERAGLGTGMVLPAPFLERVMAGSAQRAGFSPTEMADQLGSFVAIDLAAGVDPGGFLTGLGDLAAWDQLGFQPFRYTKPVRPAQIADVAAMRSAPVLLAIVVAAAMAVGLVLAIRAAARSRRRELAVLRSLGATSRQLRSTLRWQSLTVVGVGLVVGVPLGVALGQVTWRAFAHSLGIPPQPAVPVGWTALIAASALLIGIAAAAVPSRSAIRIASADALRNE